MYCNIFDMAVVSSVFSVPIESLEPVSLENFIHSELFLYLLVRVICLYSIGKLALPLARYDMGNA